MPRPALDPYLQTLQDETFALGSRVEKAIDRAVEALRTRNLVLAQEVIDDDERVNEARYRIERQCMLLLARQAPVAHDLHIVIATLNVIVDLERIGDHAAGIARIVQMMGDEEPIKPLVDIPRMAELVCSMLHDASNAMLMLDADWARQIVGRDDQVNTLHEQVYRELLTYMLNDPKTIQRATYLLWVSHNLERIGDRVTNICERVVYARTGQMEELAVDGVSEAPGTAGLEDGP